MASPDLDAPGGPPLQSSASVRFDDGAGMDGGVGAIGTSNAPINIYNSYASPTRDGSPQRPRAHNISLKYLADRDEQERLIRDHLERFQGSRRPILLFAHGEASQSLDGFVDRLGKETIRRLLGTINNTNHIEWKWVAWPDRGNEAEHLAGYKKNLSIAFERSTSDIVERIASYRRPVLLTSAHRESADRDEQPVIRGVLDYWASLPDLRTELSLIVVVAMAYADAKLNFFARFRGQPKPSALGRKLAQFNCYRSSDLNVLVLPQLSDISLSEAEHWVRHWLQPPDIEETLKCVREAFGATTAMPMDRLAPHLEKLVPKNREAIRQQ
jgi:hypothetical protein